MDEEDLADLRESQKLVDTSESMDLDFWGKRGQSSTDNDECVHSTLAKTESNCSSVLLSAHFRMPFFQSRSTQPAERSLRKWAGDQVMGLARNSLTNSISGKPCLHILYWHPDWW